MEEAKGTYRLLMEKPESKTNSKDLVVEGKIISKWIFKKIGWQGVEWIDLPQEGCTPHVVGSCEHGNEPSGSTKCGEFVD